MSKKRKGNDDDPTNCKKQFCNRLMSNTESEIMSTIMTTGCSAEFLIKGKSSKVHTVKMGMRSNKIIMICDCINKDTEYCYHIQYCLLHLCNSILDNSNEYYKTETDLKNIIKIMSTTNLISSPTG
uniref:SWIM-type domain-containing protein n=1 Tax=viral metagenome TaxID=1070528 RepID=A0A6C0EEF7_9ZZZZ